jgi:hypothetical protein
MKKTLKVTRPSKSKSKRRHLILKTIKSLSKKKFLINSSSLNTQELFLSPHNTSQFLISNNSTPFYPEEEDDLDISFAPTPLNLLIDPYTDMFKFGNENMESKNSNNELELASTAAQSQDFTDMKLNKE